MAGRFLWSGRDAEEEPGCCLSQGVLGRGPLSQHPGQAQARRRGVETRAPVPQTRGCSPSLLCLGTEGAAARSLPRPSGVWALTLDLVDISISLTSCGFKDMKGNKE